MRRHLKLLPVLIVLALAACKATPSARWGQAATVFKTAEQTVITMHDKGLIEDRDLVRIEPAVIGAKSALDESFLLLPDGGLEFESLLNIVDAVTRDLEAFYMQERQ